MLKHIKKSTFLILCVGMFLVLLGAMVLGINLGAVDLRPDWIYEIILNNITGKEIFAAEWSKSAQSIVWGMRFPKVIVCACVGAGLSLTGILMQAMTRNSLADPYILGISSGASTGATAILLVAGAFPLFQGVSVGMGAFIGAMLSSVIVMVLGGASGQFSPGKLVLSGTAVSAIFHAITNLLIFLSPDKRKVNSALFWMEGSFSSAAWEDVLPALATLLVIFAISMVINRSLDTLLLGEDIAITVGVNVRAMKLIIVLSSSLVSSSLGSYGFYERMHWLCRIDCTTCGADTYWNCPQTSDSFCHASGRYFYGTGRYVCKGCRSAVRASYWCCNCAFRRSVLLGNAEKKRLLF